MFFYLLVIVVTLSYIWYKYNYEYWKRRGVRGPKPSFLFGNLFKSLTFQMNISEMQIDWYNKFSDAPIVGFYKLTQPALMIRDPELVKEVLVKAFSSFHTNEMNIPTIEEEDDVLTKNPFFKVGEEWKRGRSIFANLFSANKVRSIFSSMMQVGDEWANYVRNFATKHEFDAKTVIIINYFY